MNQDTRPNGVQTAPFLSRPDTETEKAVNIAVRLVMEVGLSAAEEYLISRGVDKITTLRVLSYDPRVRRRPR